jgi:hypothetical protein
MAEPTTRLPTLPAERALHSEGAPRRASEGASA